MSTTAYIMYLELECMIMCVCLPQSKHASMYMQYLSIYTYLYSCIPLYYTTYHLIS